MCGTSLYQPESGKPTLVPGSRVNVVVENGVVMPPGSVEHAFFAINLELYIGLGGACLAQGRGDLQKIVDGIACRLGLEFFRGNLCIIGQCEQGREIVTYGIEDRLRDFLVLRRQVSDLGARILQELFFPWGNLSFGAFEIGPPVILQLNQVWRSRLRGRLGLLGDTDCREENSEQQDNESCRVRVLHSVSS